MNSLMPGILMLLAVRCEAGPVGAPPLECHAPPPSIEFFQMSSERAVPERLGSHRFPGTRWNDGPETTSFMPTLEVIGSSARFIEALAMQYGVRYRIDVQRSDLVRRVGNTVSLSMRQGEPPREDGVWLAGGSAVTVLEESEGWLRVSPETWPDIQGWLPHGVLQDIWRDQPFLEFRMDHIVDAVTPVSTESRESFLTLGRQGVRILDDSTESRSRISITSPAVRVVGWVDAESLTPVDGLIRGGEGGGATWGASHRIFVELPTGALLRVDPCDAVSAVTTGRSRVYLRSVHQPPWFHVGYRTSWGDHDAWMRCDVANVKALLANPGQCEQLDFSR